ncbi:ATP-binding cassette domain-containing protein [Azospirillum sp. SYSU D00513]|uniref:peptidase domain-containing ABC transporter n=1 Tax=Azospirillum sp. SYSU D00513 TaxID=2812561 RepID=UPI001A96C3DE|nr:ATP-binding cassette domain-containing protein [Azospirillum sp. SYSU D00513]
MDSRGKNFSAVFGRFTSLRQALPDLIAASLVINILSLSLPLVLLQIYDRIIPNHSSSTLVLLILGLFASIALDTAVKMLRSYVTGWLGARFEHLLSCEALRRLLNASTMDFSRAGASVHLERLRGTGQVRDFYSGQAILGLFDLPFVAVYLLLIWAVGGWLVLVPVVLLVLFVLVALLNGRFLRESINAHSRHDERRFSFITDALEGIHSIKTMALEGMMLRRYELLQQSNVQSAFREMQHSIFALNLGSLFSQLTTVLVVAGGGYAVITGDMTPGGLAACVSFAGRCLQPVQGALSTWVRFQSFSVAREQLGRLFETPPDPRVDAPPLPPVTGGIVLEGVALHHPGSAQPLLSGIALRVEPGECIAITGESGCGKTSLLSLVGGLILPTAGTVHVDGHDLAKHHGPSLRRQIAYIPQQATLFDGTILDNITMFDQDLETKAREISIAVGLDSLVSTMRDGYDTVVGSGASESLPAGIKQRIAIVRALIHDPRIVLFDEANLSIDSAGDDQLRKFLTGLKGSLTLVLVSHRPSLLRLADRVFIIRDGTLAESEAGQLGRGAPTAEIMTLPVPGERPPEDTELTSCLLNRFPTPSDLSVALVALLTASGWSGDPRHLAEALPHFSNDFDLTDFRQVMANLNHASRTRRTSARSIADHELPCLFLARDGRAFVLLRRDQGALLAFDPLTLSTGPLPKESLHGEAHIFTRKEPAESAANAADQRSWVGRVLLRFQPLAWLIMLLTLAVNVLTLASAGFVLVMYDRVLPTGDFGAIPALAAGVVMALGVEFVFRWLRARLLAYIGARCDFAIGSAIFGRILALPAWSTERVPVGSQVARIKDFESLREMFIGPVALLLYEVPAVLVYVAMAAYLNPSLLLVVLFMVVAYGLLALLSQPGLRTRVSAAARANTMKQEFLADTLAKMIAIKASGAEEDWLARFRQLSGKAAQAELLSQQYSSRVALLSQVVGAVTGVGAIALSVLHVFQGSANMGLVVATMLVVWRLIAPVQSAFMSLSTLVRVRSSVRQIDNLMRLRGDRDTTGSNRPKAKLKGAVSFARVSFRYSNEADPALLGVNLNIPAGSVVAFTGPNGAGKSTLVKLVTGVYTPQAGSVRIDNVDIRQIDPSDLRSAISYAPQQCDLFYGTIAQNLRLAHPLASDEELHWACRMAAVLDDIEALPNGLATRITDGQANQLPLGFRQRLVLARAYLRPAPVLILDEPGNGLDARADLAFQHAIRRLRGQSTILLVTHRPSHLRLADMVVLMEGGYVRQIGPFKDMEAKIMGAVS